MHEVLLPGELGEWLGGEVGPAGGDQQLQRGRAQGAARGDDRLGGEDRKSVV